MNRRVFGRILAALGLSSLCGGAATKTEPLVYPLRLFRVTAHTICSRPRFDDDGPGAKFTVEPVGTPEAIRWCDQRPGDWIVCVWPESPTEIWLVTGMPMMCTTMTPPRPGVPINEVWNWDLSPQHHKFYKALALSLDGPSPV